MTDTKDALLIKRRSTGWKVSIDAEASDVNGDGGADTKDALLISRRSTGWKVSFSN